jgi:hypothetical protein
LACALALSGCSEVVESQRLTLEFGPSGERQSCVSSLGSYSLPKANLHVKVQQGGGPATLLPFSDNSVVEVVRRPDPSLFFCLDHLSSAFTADKISVKKWGYQPVGNEPARSTSSFLGAVVVNSTDQAVYIVNALLRSLFILVTGDPNFLPPAAREAKVLQPVAELEFDPFDSRESTVANERLRQLGYCFVLEGYTFDTRRFSIDQYCNAPERIGGRPSMVTKAYERAAAQPADPFQPGLFYRPRHPYRLAIFRKTDPRGRGRWHLSQTTTVELENLSPVLSLDIRRAAFGARTANFVFNEGTLLTACVSKTSEIEGFVQIPLQISRSIVAVPQSIIQIRIDQFKGQTALLKAQEDLFKVQQAHLQALTSGQFKSPGGKTEFTAPELKLDLSKPGDLVQRDPAQGYGSDLFGVELKKLCETGATS